MTRAWYVGTAAVHSCGMTSDPTGLDTRRLGRTGPTVSSPALVHGPVRRHGPTDDDEGVQVIRTYLDAGGTLLDTGDFYGGGHNEELIR